MSKEKFSKMKTSDLINLMDDDLSVEDYDFAWEVLNEREVIRYLKEQIDDNDKNICENHKVISKLKDHKHDVQGRPVVPL